MRAFGCRTQRPASPSLTHSDSLTHSYSLTVTHSLRRKEMRGEIEICLSLTHSHSLTHSLTNERTNERMHQRANERTNEQTHERTNELRTNKRTNERQRQKHPIPPFPLLPRPLRPDAATAPTCTPSSSSRLLLVGLCVATCVMRRVWCGRRTNAVSLHPTFSAVRAQVARLRPPSWPTRRASTVT